MFYLDTAHTLYITCTLQCTKTCLSTQHTAHAGCLMSVLHTIYRQLVWGLTCLNCTQRKTCAGCDVYLQHTARDTQLCDHFSGHRSTPSLYSFLSHTHTRSHTRTHTYIYTHNHLAGVQGGGVHKRTGKKGSALPVLLLPRQPSMNDSNTGPVSGTAAHTTTPPSSAVRHRCVCFTTH